MIFIILYCIDGTLLDKLTKGSNRKVKCKCDNENCNNEWETNYFHVSEKENQYCKSCVNKINMVGKQKSKEHKENLSKSVKRYFNENIDAKEQCSKNAKQSWINGNLKGFAFTEQRKINLRHSLNTKEVKEFRSDLMSGRIKNGYNTFTKTKNGHYYSNKMEKEIHYRSSYELKAYEILEHDKNVKEYYTEYISIPYYKDNIKKNYIPDIFVKYINDNIKIIEVKPKTLLNFGDNPLKINALEVYCKSNNYEFEIWTEDNIST